MHLNHALEVDCPHGFVGRCVLLRSPLPPSRWYCISARPILGSRHPNHWEILCDCEIAQLVNWDDHFDLPSTRKFYRVALTLDRLVFPYGNGRRYAALWTGQCTKCRAVYYALAVCRRPDRSPFHPDREIP